MMNQGQRMACLGVHRQFESQSQECYDVLQIDSISNLTTSKN